MVSADCTILDLPNIVFPDAKFKNKLLNHNPVIDTNGDNEIQVVEAISVEYLAVSNSSSTPDNEKITDLTGIEAFINVKVVSCDYNLLTNLDFSQNTLLTDIGARHNLIVSLNVSQNALLEQITINDNQLTNIDLSQNNKLTDFRAQNNLLTTIDLSQNGFMYDVFLQNNKLISMNLKNGFHEDETHFENNPDLLYICADDVEFSYIQEKLDLYGYSNTVLNSYCSFVPGGEFFTIQGQSIIDSNNDGCDGDDPVFPNLIFNVTDGITNGEFISDTSGNYSIPLQAGTHTITPIFESPDYFTISPTSFIVDFPTDTSPYIQDFCITPSGAFNDLEVTIIPLELARPGFDVNYKIIYKNKGSTTLSGSINLNFNDDIMDLVSANPIADVQNIGSLSWNYTNLLPFESRTINFTMNLNTPTDPNFPVNGGDILVYNATINPVAGDETQDDNAFTLNQTVVNSLDPNDKTCLEGYTITTDLIGEFVHYLIRFENVGTASAINVVVKDIIDTSKFDIASLFTTDASHSFVTSITNTNEVEFIFENINLPFDDANNDGYLAFKIKTLSTLNAGDSFDNDAEIYFDFNAPIITNNYLTSIENSLSINKLNNLNLKIYPNPVSDKLFIEIQEPIKSITFYDINGRLISQIALIGNSIKQNVDISQLANGIYFVKIKSNVGQYTSKIIKE